MQVGRTSAVAATFLAVMLAGCSGSGGSGAAISVKEPAAPGGEYEFSTGLGGDNFTWNLGDHMTVLYGKKVRHTYDFTDAQLTVRLIVTRGGQATTYTQSITLGSGSNEAAGFILEGATKWAVTGEAVRFTAENSVDPEGVALRYNWNCVRKIDATRVAPHPHPGFSGPTINFAAPPPSTVTTRIAETPIAAVDRVVEGDLCDSLGTGGHGRLDKSIEGTFEKTGVYDIYLIAGDPGHNTASGFFRILVGEPSDRPAQHLVVPFSGTFRGGYEGNINGTLNELNQQGDGGVWDSQTFPAFPLELAGVAGWMEIDIEGGAGNPVGNFTLKKGSTTIAQGETSGEPMNVTIAASRLQIGSYSLTARLDQGADVDFTATVHVLYDMNPFQIYQEPI